MRRAALCCLAVVTLSLATVVPQQVALAGTTPSFTVFIDLDPQHVVGFWWTPGSTVTLEIDNGADSTIDFTTSTTVDANGDVGFREGGFHVTEGDLVRLSDDLTPQNVAWTHVDHLTLSTVDAAADVLAGEARTGTEVFVYSCPPFPCTYLGEATGDGNGHWQVNLGSVFDLVPGAEGIAQTDDPDGVPPYANHTQVKWRVPNPWFEAGLQGGITARMVDGCEFSADSTVDVVIKDTNGTTLFEGQASTDGDGCFRSDSPFDMVPGMVVSVSDERTTKELTLVPMSIDVIDTASDTAAGTAPPNTTFNVDTDICPGNCGNFVSAYPVVSDGDGKWMADFGALGVDLVPGNDLGANISDEDGDNTIVDQWVPTAQMTVSAFSPPVDNDAVNVARAGRTVPFKFRVTDAYGDPVTDLTGVQVTVNLGACETGLTTDAIEQYTSGSGLVNLGDGYYQYDFKTAKTWAGQCGTLGVDVGSGGIRTAEFKFKA